MKGWKTWVAVAGLLCLTVVDVMNGDYEAAGQKATMAFGLVGIGHKIDKVSADKVTAS